MAREPGSIREIVTVDLERPRERIDPAFGEYYQRVRDLIQ